MMRFQEYLQIVKGRKTVLNEALPSRYQYQPEAIDLNDGRAFMPLTRSESMTEQARMPRKPHYGKQFLPGKYTFGKMKQWFKPPASDAAKYSDGDELSLYVVEPTTTVKCSNSRGGIGFITIYGDTGFKGAYLFQMSFNEAVTFILISGSGVQNPPDVNPFLLVPLMGLQQGVFEDEDTPLPPPADDYDRAAVLACVKDQKSHFSKNKARSSMYGQQIINAGGDVGNTLAVKTSMGADSGLHKYDNYYTDQNFLVAMDPVRGFCMTIEKIAPMRLVQLYGLSLYNLEIKESGGKKNLFIPFKSLLLSAQDAMKGRIV